VTIKHILDILKSLNIKEGPLISLDLIKVSESAKTNTLMDNKP
jgi:hypothetical protein